MLELGKASSSVYKNFIFKYVPVVKILQWKKLLIYSIFLKLIPRISYDQNFEINRWWSDLYSCQVERKQKYLIQFFLEEVIGNFYN